MKRGFTLIELLAVILILGIIALIAIPTVNNILKEARRGAFSSTLTNIEKTIENECNLSQIKNKNINNVYIISNGIISPNVEIKGNLPDGTIYANKNCEISYALFNNNFTGNKEIGEEPIIHDKKSNGIYKEDILNGTDPILSSNLIPVRIEKDGTVFKADLNSKWYSYEEKKWANAVILTNTGKVEDNGMILEDSIESYFVWIPRYKYKLFDMGNYHGVIDEKPTTSYAKTIEIVFENKNTSISVGNEVGEYHSHPAFQAFDVNGLWIGKFETNLSGTEIKIKPNLKAVRHRNVTTQFDLAYSYKRNNDSHMMKNTEWGAAAYLSHSKYGINKEVNINNNSDFITGYSAVVGTNQSKYPGTYGNTSDKTLPYNTETGYLASTTGNISGIYDMSGGSHEYMAIYREYIDNSNAISLEQFSKGGKYFDIYGIDFTTTSFNNRILGDATGEIGPFYNYVDGDNVLRLHSNWYGDKARFLGSTTNNHCIFRGGYHYNGILSGQFAFNTGGCESHQNIGFRIVLTN